MPYMWNRSNPYVYSDPSGYTTMISADFFGRVDWRATAPAIGADLEIAAGRVLGGAALLLSLKGDTA